MIVYSVDSSMQDDYSCVGVFSTREKAEEYRDRLNKGQRYPEYEVVVRKLDEPEYYGD